nr:hypothetical protein CFP56_50816 [Quercus suber]
MKPSAEYRRNSSLPGDLARQLSDGIETTPYGRGAFAGAHAGARAGTVCFGLGLVDEVGGASAADVVDGRLDFAALDHLLVEVEHGLLGRRVHVACTATAGGDGPAKLFRWSRERNTRCWTGGVGASGQGGGGVAFVVARTATAAHQRWYHGGHTVDTPSRGNIIVQYEKFLQQKPISDPSGRRVRWRSSSIESSGSRGRGGGPVQAFAERFSRPRRESHRPSVNCKSLTARGIVRTEAGAASEILLKFSKGEFVWYFGAWKNHGNEWFGRRGRVSGTSRFPSALVMMNIDHVFISPLTLYFHRVLLHHTCRIQ